MDSVITKIRFREDSKENWTNINPILASAEPGVEIDTNKFKIGDGVKHWNDLPYQLSDTSDLSALTNRVQLLESEVAELREIVNGLTKSN